MPAQTVRSMLLSEERRRVGTTTPLEAPSDAELPPHGRNASTRPPSTEILPAGVGVLSNLLPGAREVRAPLAAGYLWLLAIGLALASSLPSRSQATGVYDDFYAVGDLLGSVGAALAVSFLAYFVGALSSSVFAVPFRLVEAPVNGVADSVSIVWSFLRHRRSMEQRRALGSDPLGNNEDPPVAADSIFQVIRRGMTDSLTYWVDE